VLSFVKYEKHPGRGVLLLKELMLVAVFFRAEMAFGVHRFAALGADGASAAGEFDAPFTHGCQLGAGDPEANLVHVVIGGLVCDDFADDDDGLVLF
jgi:hypothetical protein